MKKLLILATLTLLLALPISAFATPTALKNILGYAGISLIGVSGVTTAPLSEPATMLLLGTGLIGLAGLGRKKFSK